MQKIENSELNNFINLSEGYLVNWHSAVKDGNKHVIYVLPLVSDCRGHLMKSTKQYPLYYVLDRADLVTFGTQGQDWKFGKCCQGRLGAF